VNENAVLYALSTLAQTCAALAAFVGAIGLFLLQSIREQQRSSEQAMRVSLVDVYSNYHEVVYVLSLSVVLKQVEQARREPDRVGTTRAKRIEDAFETWNGFAPAAWLRSQTERRVHERCPPRRRAPSPSSRVAPALSARSICSRSAMTGPWVAKPTKRLPG